MTEPYRHSITAADADIDELGHVSNLVYLRWVLETATAHSTARGWSFADYQALGSMWIVRRHELDYLAQVTAGQQLVAETWVDSWRGASCVRRTTILRDRTIVAQAATTWVFMSLASGKPMRIPQYLRAQFE